VFYKYAMKPSEHQFWLDILIHIESLPQPVWG